MRIVHLREHGSVHYDTKRTPSKVDFLDISARASTGNELYWDTKRNVVEIEQFRGIPITQLRTTVSRDSRSSCAREESVRSDLSIFPRKPPTRDIGFARRKPVNVFGTKTIRNDVSDIEYALFKKGEKNRSNTLQHFKFIFFANFASRYFYAYRFGIKSRRFANS